MDVSLAQSRPESSSSRGEYPRGGGRVGRGRRRVLATGRAVRAAGAPAAQRSRINSTAQRSALALTAHRSAAQRSAAPWLAAAPPRGQPGSARRPPWSADPNTCRCNPPAPPSTPFPWCRQLPASDVPRPAHAVDDASAHALLCAVAHAAAGLEVQPVSGCGSGGTAAASACREAWSAVGADIEPPGHADPRSPPRLGTF
jgi:hypothetical protein